MTRRAFVHIGTHKTGTTYLQRWMRSNSQALASLGLMYPTIGLSGFNAAHSKLSYDVRATRGGSKPGQGGPSSESSCLAATMTS